MHVHMCTHVRDIGNLVMAILVLSGKVANHNFVILFLFCHCRRRRRADVNATVNQWQLTNLAALHRAFQFMPELIDVVNDISIETVSCEIPLWDNNHSDCLSASL